MIPVWWSVLLAAVGIGGLLLAGRGAWQGWAVGIAAQLLWVAYAIATGQPGFLLSAAAYGAVNGLNLWRWLHAPIAGARPAYARREPDLQARWDEGYQAGVAAAARERERYGWDGYPDRQDYDG